MNVIELKNVSKIYQKDFWVPKVSVITDLSLFIKKGLVTGFVGPNGAGKTTVIKMIMGLVKPSSGTVSICGMDAFNPGSRKGVSYLCEQPYFYTHLTVAESLRFAANLLGFESSTIKTELTRVLSVVDIANKSNVRIRDLSKGLQQRLSMAQALLGDPQILILDEPMSGMDPPGRRLFRNLFNELVKKGKTVFFSTHVLDDIESVCDEVIVLSEGKTSFAGGVSTLLSCGFSGIEMVVSELDQDDKDILEKSGCKLTTASNNQNLLFLQDGYDLKKVQKYLFNKNVAVYSIFRRNKSLEELLYQNKGALSR